MWQDRDHPSNIWVVISSKAMSPGNDLWSHVMFHLIRGSLEYHYAENRRSPWDRGSSGMKRLS